MAPRTGTSSSFVPIAAWMRSRKKPKVWRRLTWNSNQGCRDQPARLLPSMLKWFDQNQTVPLVHALAGVDPAPNADALQVFAGPSLLGRTRVVAEDLVRRVLRDRPVGQDGRLVVREHGVVDQLRVQVRLEALGAGQLQLGVGKARRDATHQVVDGVDLSRRGGRQAEDRGQGQQPSKGLGAGACGVHTFSS